MCVKDPVKVKLQSVDTVGEGVTVGVTVGVTDGDGSICVSDPVTVKLQSVDTLGEGVGEGSTVGPVDADNIKVHPAEVKVYLYDALPNVSYLYIFSSLSSDVEATTKLPENSPSYLGSS